MKCIRLRPDRCRGDLCQRVSRVRTSLLQGDATLIAELDHGRRGPGVVPAAVPMQPQLAPADAPIAAHDFQANALCRSPIAISPFERSVSRTFHRSSGNPIFASS